MEDNNYSVRIDSIDLPVRITVGEGDVQVIVHVEDQGCDYIANVSEATADMLASSSDCHMHLDSQEFKQLLIKQIQVHGSKENPSFSFGKSSPFRKQLVENRQDEHYGRSMFTELQDIIRVIGDQKGIQKRQVRSSDVLYDAILRGFQQMQSLGAGSLEQSETLQNATTDIDQVQEHLLCLNTTLHETVAQQQNQHENLVRSTLEEFKLVRDSCTSSTEDRTSEMQKVSLQVQQVQAYQIEQTELWKKLAKQQKAEMEFLKMECSKLRKALDATHIEKTNQSIQMKDTVRLLNEGNGRVSQQVNTMRGELQFLRDMKNQQDANTQNLADLKDMYLSLLPKLQQAYLSERRREANEAVNNLQRLGKTNTNTTPLKYCKRES